MIRNVNTLQIEKSSPIFDTGTSAFAGISENKIKTLPLNESKPFYKYHEEQIALKLVTWLGERIRMLCESKMDTERVFQIVKTAKE